jgi:Protein of unknwon function (DUF3310)
MVDYEQYMINTRNQMLKERMKEASTPTVGAVYAPNQGRETLLCEKLEAIRPAHYGGAENPYEVFNVLEAWKLDKDFYLGNVIKYIARAGKKDPAKEKEDLQKALVYLRRRIDSL